MSGLFITFEGPEGSGKSTQVRLLTQSLKADNIDCLTTREPGGTEFANALRTILLDKNTGAISARAELLVMEAARADHVQKVINPALAENKIVICDRYTDSSLAYQGGGRGIEFDTVEKLNDFATKDTKPDLTIILDVTPEAGLERARGYGAKELDRLESEDIDFHIRVRKTFLDLAEKSPEQYMVINGADSVPSIAETILKKITEIIAAK